jgi:hypothetical protein
MYAVLQVHKVKRISQNYFDLLSQFRKLDLVGSYFGLAQRFENSRALARRS